ncbi:MAG: penicillin-binding protein 2 [Candidatus Erginobacter occultus]|nr:penicillin-binding protein 2 [Candidatus Erginobacter occultus]
MYKSRSRTVFIGFLIFAVLLLSRLFALQCLQHSRYQLQARGQQQSTYFLPPRRGTIYDSRGNMLAASIPCYSLYAVPREIPPERIDEIADLLFPVIDTDLEQIRSRLTGERWFVWLKRQLSEEESERIRRLALPGIGLKEDLKRVYPKGNLLSQVLGFTDPDGNGLEGLEWKFDRQLRGSPGWLLTEKDGARREVAWHRSHSLDPLDGCDIHLTVDEVIQSFAEEALERVYRQYGAAWASLLVMEPSTGKILALANRPTFDPNVYPLSTAEERRNRTITDPIEPGSTFKVFPAAAALEAGLVARDTEFYCEEGAYWIGGRPLRDSSPHGILRFDEILQKSSNIGMAKVGMIMGRDNLYQSLVRFGIGRNSGIELPGEAPGTLRHPRDWSGLSLRSITMGHEVSMTALGLLTAFSALGNGGVLVQPRIVDRVEAPTGEVLYRYPVREKGRVVSEETAREMLDILSQVSVEGGTGRRAAIKGFPVAGKTGTAQKLSPEGGYSHSLYRALYMGLVPASRPRLAILVVVDEPRPEYYGGVVSAPVFKEVGERIIRYLDLEPVRPGEELPT